MKMPTTGARKKPAQGFTVPAMMTTMLPWMIRRGALFAFPLLIGTVACQREAGSADPEPVEAIATIRVDAGNGRLAGGEQFSIAEWRSGREAATGKAFAHFRGQDGGPTLDLNVTGLKGVGIFSCAEDGTARLELRVDVNNAYRAAPESPCSIVVRRVHGGLMEGHYTAVLRHAGNPRDEMSVSGEFRATQPAPEIKAAQITQMKNGPKLVGRR